MIATTTKLTRQITGVSAPPTWAKRPIIAGSRNVR